MGFDTMIVNGRVVTATDTYASDIAVSNGKIEAIGNNLPRDNAKKIHNSMVPFSALPESEREKDREAIRTYPDVLDRAGYKIVFDDQRA